MAGTEEAVEDTTNEDSTTLETLENELISDLAEELTLSDKNFNATLLTIKAKSAIRDVKDARKYPSYYSEEQIVTDLYSYYSNCRAIALNDYNKIGIDTETSHNENSVSASYVDRDKLFKGIVPLAK